jgi:hypothetical protein
MISVVVLDQSTVEKLKAASVGVEVRDENGALLGYFEPAVTPETIDQYECPLSEEELAHIAREGGGRPLADILSDLGNRS